MTMPAHILGTLALPVLVAALCITAAFGFAAIGMRRCALAAGLGAAVVVGVPIGAALLDQAQQIDWLPLLRGVSDWLQGF